MNPNTLATAPPMTGPEMVALTTGAHALRVVGPVQGRSDPGRGREGLLVLDARGQALPRLQQPVDVREHRPRRSARDQGDPGSGGHARLRQPVHGHRAARAARRKARVDRPGRHRRLLLHQRRRRGERERHQDRADVHRPPQDPGALPLVSRRDRRARLRSPAIRGAGRPSRASRASSTSPIRITASSAAGTTSDLALANLEEVIQLEGPHTIAAFFLETGDRHQRHPGAARRLSPGRPRRCARSYGILMVADEVMAGFGRTGEWFAVNHWHVVPDLLTMAKGLTSAYVPLGAVGMRRAHRRSLQGQGVLRRPDLQQPSARLRRGACDDRRLRG